VCFQIGDQGDGLMIELWPGTQILTPPREVGTGCVAAHIFLIHRLLFISRQGFSLELLVFAVGYRTSSQKKHVKALSLPPAAKRPVELDETLILVASRLR
jgi:hypothetical protein